MKKERIPKADYFRLRYQQSLENGLTQKAEYYKSRLEQMGEPLTKDNYSDTVKKCVNVFNAPKGTVNQKMEYLHIKLKQEGIVKDEATTIILEALNIASNGELLSNI
jgi:hypothetical protein